MKATNKFPPVAGELIFNSAPKYEQQVLIFRQKRLLYEIVVMVKIYICFLVPKNLVDKPLFLILCRWHHQIGTRGISRT